MTGSADDVRFREAALYAEGSFEGWGNFGLDRGTVYVTDVELVCAHSESVSVLRELPNAMLFGIPVLLGFGPDAEAPLEDAGSADGTVRRPLEAVTGVTLHGTGITTDPYVSVAFEDAEPVLLRPGTSARNAGKNRSRNRALAEAIESAAIDAGAEVETADG